MEALICRWMRRGGHKRKRRNDQPRHRKAWFLPCFEKRNASLFQHMWGDRTGDYSCTRYIHSLAVDIRKPVDS